MHRPTTYDDVMYMAENIRDADKEEVRLIAGLSPMQSLSIGFINSAECITGIGKGGKIFCIAGVTPLQKGFAAIWMLSTPDITNAKRDLVTDGVKWVKRMRRTYGQLSNCVSEDNVVHRKLIEYMGFRFGKPFKLPGKNVRAIPFKR